MSSALKAGAWLALVPALLSFAPRPAAANPAGSIYTPAITEGEREIELQFGAVRLRDGSSEVGVSTSFAFAPRAWWAIEFGIKGQRAAGDRFRYDAWEVEQRFALTEPGRFPVDLGFLLEVERPRDRAEGWELRYGPLLQAQWGDLQGNLNLLFERHLRAESGPGADFGYQWQLRRRADPILDWGAQGIGELGPWRHWNHGVEQSHQLGPAVFGRIKTTPTSAFKYDAALLFGTGGQAPKRALRARLEYEFF